MMEFLGDYMKNIYKYIIKLCFLFFVMFLFNSNVKAFQYVSRILVNSVKSLCDEEACIPLCTYGDDILLSQTGFAERNEKYNFDYNERIIGFVYDKTKNGPITANGDGAGWIITFPGEVSTSTWKPSSWGSTAAVVFYSVSDTTLPTSNILALSENFKTVPWEKTNLYSNIYEKLECPKYMFYESDGDAIIFLPDIDDRAYAFSLNYSFKDELDVVLSKTLSDLSWRFYPAEAVKDPQFVNNSKIKFLVDLDNESGIGYSEQHNGEQMVFESQFGVEDKESLQKYCPYFKSVMETDEGVSYVKGLLDVYNDSYQDKINNKLKEYASGIERQTSIYQLKNVAENVYNLDTLGKILVYKENGELKYRNDKYKQLYNLLSDDVQDSLKYVNDVCAEGGVNIGYNSDAVDELIEESYSIYKYKDPEIKFDYEFQCSILSDFADIISTGYFIIEMLGLAILILLSSMDYIKIFLNDNADELKKANSNLAKRLIIVVILFLLPAILNVVFSIFKIEGFNSEDPLCRKVVNISNK